MTPFLIAWSAAAIALIVLAGWVGRQATGNLLGILIDARGRYSLTHFQIVLWTIVILSSAIGALIKNDFSPDNFGLTPQLLGLMGISAGSAVLTTSVKAAKDTPGSLARVARAGVKMATAGGAQRTIAPMFSQIWLQEEGDLADQVIDITKFQNFLFTLIVLGFYLTLAVKADGLPVLPANVVALIGISDAGYVGGKVPNR